MARTAESLDESISTTSVNLLRAALSHKTGSMAECPRE
jgi:hypothetical protein